MAKFADRVVETTQTTGTGTLDLDGAQTGFRAFSDELITGQTVYYAIEDDPKNPTEYEYGIGTWTSGSPNTLSRDTVEGSSNGGSKISLTGGTTYTVSAVVTKSSLGGQGPLQQGALKSRQVFEADGTYTKPAGLVRARVEVIGAGGGSGGCAATGASQAAGANGGAAGGSAIELLEASAIGATETVTVGDGGTAGSAGNNAGGQGETSSFGGLLSATGGNGGAGGPALSNDSPNGSSGPAGGIGSGSDVDSRGDSGGVGFASASGAVGMGGFGASSRYGGGAQSVVSGGSAAGIAGKDFGGGASGSALGPSQPAVAGSIGGKGIVIVWEYF